MAVEAYLKRLRGVTRERVLRSLRFRTMRVLGRFDAVRSLSAASRNGAARRDESATLFPGVDVASSVAGIRDNGYKTGLVLPPDVLSEIRAWAEQTPCYGNMNPRWGFLPADRAAAERAAGTGFTVAHYFNSERCPAIARLHDDPVLRQIAERYVGPRARFIATHMWWSFARDGADAKAQHRFAQMFHYDLDDYRFLKFFFYLTDVDERAGPHVYVRGSNRGRSLSQLFPLRRYADDEVERWFGSDRIDVVTAPAGAGFVVDTFGIHKGATPTGRDRLLLQLEVQQRAYGFETDRARDEDLERIA